MKLPTVLVYFYWKLNNGDLFPNKQEFQEIRAFITWRFYNDSYGEIQT